MRVLVIGGSGKVGSLVMPALARRHVIRVFDLSPPADASLEYCAGDVQDSDALARAAEGMEALLYMAMGPFRDHRCETQSAFDVNVKGVYLALDAAHRAGIAHAVYTSSMSVYHDLGSRYFDDESIPPDAREVYGFTKRLGEEVCANAAARWGMSVNALRLCHPMSEERWLAHTRAGMPTIATAAGDVARAILAALEYQGHGFQAFMISGDYEEKLMRMDKARRLLGWEPQARPHPQEPASAAP